MKVTSISATTRSAKAVRMSGKTARRGRQRTSSNSTPMTPIAVAPASSARRSFTPPFAASAIARSRSGPIDSAKTRRPASLDCSVRPALRGRVAWLRPLGHGTKGLARKSVLERATRPIDQEDIVAFLDARRGQEEVRGEDQGGQESGAGPAPGAKPDRSGENDEHAGRQKGEDIEIVDRKSERDEDKDQHRELRQDALRVRALHDRRGM